MTIAEQKAEIRKKLRSMRREQDRNAAAEASDLICKRVMALDEYKNAGVILAYMAASCFIFGFFSVSVIDFYPLPAA